MKYETSRGGEGGHTLVRCFFTAVRMEAGCRWYISYFSTKNKMQGSLATYNNASSLRGRGTSCVQSLGGGFTPQYISPPLLQQALTARFLRSGHARWLPLI